MDGLEVNIKNKKKYIHWFSNTMDTREGWLESCFYHVNVKEDGMTPGELFDMLVESGFFIEYEEKEAKDE
jgi:hypothetical protein